MNNLIIRKIISGGQTGVDEGAIAGARQLGIDTGGTAPKGYRTEKGANYLLRDVYGLKEHADWRYPPRTKQNVLDADATIIVHVKGVVSPGSQMTRALAEAAQKPCYWIEIEDLYDPKPYVRVLQWIETAGPQVLNFAGHRESSVPGIQEWTRAYIVGLLGD